MKKQKVAKKSEAKKTEAKKKTRRPHPYKGKALPKKHRLAIIRGIKAARRSKAANGLSAFVVIKHKRPELLRTLADAHPGQKVYKLVPAKVRWTPVVD